jgi:hypothetical protein
MLLQGPFEPCNAFVTGHNRSMECLSRCDRRTLAFKSCL